LNSGAQASAREQVRPRLWRTAVFGIGSTDVDANDDYGRIGGIGEEPSHGSLHLLESPLALALIFKRADRPACEPRRQRGSSSAALASVPLSRSGVAASAIASASALAKQW